MSTVQGGQGNIVTNGLVLNLDAANPRSYPQPYNGTIWQNIAPVSSSLTGSLVNGVAYTGSNGGALVFDGVNDYVDLGNILFPSGTISFTIDIWVYFKDLNVTDYIFSKGSGADGTIGSTFYLVGGPNYVRFTATDSIPTRSTNLEYATPLNTWHNLTYTYNGSTITSYKNATIPFTTNSISGTLNYVTQPIRIGVHRYLSNFPSMDVSSFKIYNRALNASEVLQNFNATRARFGI
jgi:hypothetical protein